MFHRTGLAVGLALLLGAGCTHGPSSPMRPGDPLDARQFETATSSVLIGGTTLRLSASSWRDFMPIQDSGGSPLTVAATLRASGSGLPAGLTVENLIVRHGGELWVARKPDDQRILDEGSLQAIARGGPRWDAGDEVDVLVKVAASGGAAYMVARGVAITATAVRGVTITDPGLIR